MRRRRLLQASAVGLAAGLAGCSEHVHRARGANMPVSLLLSNYTDERRTLSVLIDRDGDVVFDGAATIDGESNVRAIDGDDFREAEFTAAGDYVVAVEVDGRRFESTVEVTWSHLADCNANMLSVDLSYGDHDDVDVRIGLVRTAMGCGGIDALL